MTEGGESTMRWAKDTASAAARADAYTSGERRGAEAVQKETAVGGGGGEDGASDFNEKDGKARVAAMARAEQSEGESTRILTETAEAVEGTVAAERAEVTSAVRSGVLWRDILEGRR
mmetsp:Transcript_25333/g.52638  ORF Transcript_25333/g.52638 Transcript_25333/m.52638 type:complete len:117 (-) Transcript_25333:342-692(-)